MRKIKSIAAVILSLGMVMAGSLTSFAAELPEQRPEESVSVEIMAESAVESYTRTYVVGNGVRLRRTPGTDGEVVGLLYEDQNDWVNLNGVERVVDGIYWRQVTNSSIGVGGWISRDYLELE